MTIHYTSKSLCDGKTSIYGFLNTDNRGRISSPPCLQYVISKHSTSTRRNSNQCLSAQAGDIWRNHDDDGGGGGGGGRTAAAGTYRVQHTPSPLSQQSYLKPRHRPGPGDRYYLAFIRGQC